MRYLRAIREVTPEHIIKQYTAHDGSPTSKPISMVRVSRPLEQTFTRITAGHFLGDTDRADRQLLDYYAGRVPVKSGTSNIVLANQKMHEGDHVPTLPFHESGLIVDKKARDEGLLRLAEQDEQLQLFGHVPEQRAYVDYLLSRDTPKAKISAMTMLGMADLEERKQSGQSLRPSEDLSDYSMRVVRRLNKSRAIDDSDVPARPNNDFDFSHANRLLNDLPSEAEATSEHVDVSHQSADAKTHLKSILRPKRNATTTTTTTTPSHLSEQLRLFED